MNSHFEVFEEDDGCIILYLYKNELAFRIEPSVTFNHMKSLLQIVAEEHCEEIVSTIILTVDNEELVLINKTNQLLICHSLIEQSGEKHYVGHHVASLVPDWAPPLILK